VGMELNANEEFFSASDCRPTRQRPRNVARPLETFLENVYMSEINRASGDIKSRAMLRSLVWFFVRMK
jgi:hypothetical protein